MSEQTIPFTVMRAAYLMSNWDGPIEGAAESGNLPTMLPQDLTIPMVSPRDLATVAADLLEADPMPLPVHVEGPRRYTPRDVATALAKATDRQVRCEVAPRPAWAEAFTGMGFSEEAAQSYAEMTGTVIDEKPRPVEGSIKGTVTIEDHVRSLIPL